MPWGRGALGAVFVYVGLSIALTYPLVAHLTSVVPSDPGDPLLSTFLLWWNAHTVPLTQAWWNAPLFFPTPDALALSEHFLGLSFLTNPITWATGQPQLAYNVAFLLTFILSGLAGHVLGYGLTGRHDAALIAGLAFAFAPYRMAQFPHIHVLASFWMPVALAALHRFTDDERWRWLVIFCVVTMLQGLTSGQYALYFPVLIALWVLWFPIAQRRFRSAALVLIAFAGASLPVAFILLRYAEVHRALGLSRHIDEVLTHSADITALVRGEANLRFWGGTLVEPAAEGQLFPGATVVALVIGGLMASGYATKASRPARAAVIDQRPLRRSRWIWRALLTGAVLATLVAISLPIVGGWRVEILGVSFSVQRLSRPVSVALVLWLLVLLLSQRFRALVKSQSTLGFYVAATLVMWLLAFGPHPTFNGDRVVYWGPYRWLMLLPGFSGVRVPARFAMLATLCLAAAASVAFARLLTRAPARLAPVLTMIAALGLLADGWIRAMPLAPPPAASVLAGVAGPGAVLELPIAEVDVAAMYRSMTHRRPVANGYSGYSPPAYRVLRSGLESFDPHMLLSAAEVGVRHVVVAQGDPARTAQWDAYVRQTPGVRFVRTAEGQTHYTIDAPTPLPDRQLVAHSDAFLPLAWVRAPLHSADVERLQDNNLGTNWEIGAAQSGGADEHVIVGLDAVARVAGVRLTLGDFPTTYPRELLIERSFDCATWEPVWRGPTAGLALSAALIDPVAVPLTVRFAPTDARCLALRQLGSAPVEHWAIAELGLLGQRPSP